MANYTLTATDEQDARLTDIVAKQNTAQDTTLTSAEYLQARFDSLMNESLIRDQDRRWSALGATPGAKETALVAGEA